MMETMTHDLSGISQTAVSLMNWELDQIPVQPRTVILTIAVEAVDCVLVDVQTQIEQLRQYRKNVQLVRVELADMRALISTVFAV
jgi:hypothetical protein